MTGHDSTFLKSKTEYEAYLAYQDCLLRGEVVRINLPGDDGSYNEEGSKEEEGDKWKGRNKGKGCDKGKECGEGKDDGNGEESDEYFAEDLWPAF